MKTTALNHIHKSLGAKMVDFSGYEMPLEYSGIIEEHMTVRERVGIFDVSHMGEFWVKGPKAFELVQRLTTNDVSKLRPGQAQYSCFPNGKGGVVDDLLVYHYEEEKYMLVVNAGNIDKDWDWIVAQNHAGADLENASDRISLLAVQGPKAVETLQKLSSVNLATVKYYSFVTGNFAGFDDVIISNTGYTGSGGFELYFHNYQAEQIWNAIFDSGKEFGIKPVGLGARDTLRLEMGFCLYGNDIDDTTSPIEAGLGWITRFDEGNDFIDKNYLLMQKTEGVVRKLRGFEMIDRGIPRHGYTIVDKEGHPIGQVTSGSMSPMLNKGIGMGYIAREYSAFGTEIFIQVRNKLLKASVVKFPFVKPG